MFNFAQDIGEIATVLPRQPLEVFIVIIWKTNANTRVTNDLRIRRFFIEYWLRWFKLSNECYRHIDINQQRIGNLPLDGRLVGLKKIEEDVQLPDIHRDDDDDGSIVNIEDLDGNPVTDYMVILQPSQLYTEDDSTSRKFNRIQVIILSS